MQDVEHDFRTWVAAHRQRLRRTAYLLGGDWHLADDLVQEALTKAYSVWPRVIGRGQPDAYVRRIVVNLYLDHQRRPARREYVTDTLPDTPVAPDEGIAERERLLTALAAIPPGQRAVLVLRYWEDLSIDQTAMALRRTSGHVKSQTHHGLRALEAALESSRPLSKETE